MDRCAQLCSTNHLKAMKKGDEVLFYHSNVGLEIVGIAKVAKEAYQDPTTDEAAWVVVDLKPYKKLKKPVSLDAIKKRKKIKGHGSCSDRQVIRSACY